MDLSIVTTLYYSAPYLEESYTKACAAPEQTADSFGMILNNDDSPDFPKI